MRELEGDDWRQKFWTRDETDANEKVEKRHLWSNVEKVENRRPARNSGDDVVDVKKSSTVLTKRRFPDGIGVLRLSFSSPGLNVIHFFIKF